MIAGISGHQELGDSATVAWIRAALGDAVTRMPPQLGLTSLAAGSDQLFASVLLERDIPFDVIIPCRQYETTFDDITLRRYKDLLAKARQQITLAFHSPSKQAFWTAGQQVVDGSDLLVAIWDGQEARGLGGTGDVVSYALGTGHAVLHIDPIRRTTNSLRRSVDKVEGAEDDPSSPLQQTLFSTEAEPSSPIELYRRNEMIEATQKDWHMALLIFREMGWQPARPLEAYAHPLTFIKHDEGEAMQRAGHSLFALILNEPFVSTSVKMDLGLLYQLTEFVGGGAFIVGQPGSYEHATANDFSRMNT